MLSLNDFHEYQHNSVTELYERDRVLGMMPTGAGKTAVGLTAFSELQRADEARRAIVLAPRRVAETVWPAETAEWEQIKHLDVVYVGGTPKKRLEILDEDHDVYCVCENNIKWLEEVLATWPKDRQVFDLLIVDEASRYKNPRGSWSKVLRNKLAKRFQKVWMLTGSPRPNSELDYYTTVTVVSQATAWGASYDKWLTNNFYPTDYERRKWAIIPDRTDKINKDVARWSFRVPLEAVPRPSSDPIIHEIDMPDDARAHYKQMEREFVVNLNTKDVIAMDSVGASGKLSQMAQGFVYDENRVAQDVSTAKIDYLKEFLDRVGGDRVCLVYWYREDLKRIQSLIPDIANLGHGSAGAYGTEVQRAWNAGELQYLAIHPGSAGHGVNLQKVEAHMIHYCLTWSAELYSQTVARLARQGYAGGGRLMNHLLVCKKTIDEAKLERVQGKLDAQEAAMKYIKSVLS